jgi:hypothetical protein
MNMKTRIQKTTIRDFRRSGPILALCVALGLAVVAAGCARRTTTTTTWPEWQASPLVIVSESRQDVGQGKASVKLVVRGDPTPRSAEDLLRDYVEQHRRPDEEMWVSLYLEGMDVQSIEYAFATARPGDPIRITVRDSAQTYR